VDGARLFNAIVAKNWTKEHFVGFDTMTVSLSKGLGCPMGSVLVGDKTFI
jgi:threonine aldolase